MDGRLAAIDWMRGFVMALMAVDHASATFNAGRLWTDSAYLVNPQTGEPLWTAGAALPAGQFLTRWITHLCAPTFVFLAGTSLALSTDKRRAAGESDGQLDRHLLARGLVLIALDLVWVSLLPLLSTGTLVLQVLYTIGIGLILMIPLRRLPTGWLVLAACGWFAAGEVVTTWAALPEERTRALVTLLALAPGDWGRLHLSYPALHWLAMMMLGWALGRHLLRLRAGAASGWSAERVCAAGGIAGLAVYALVRGANGYGNMLLYRDDASLLHWLHVSKYPPSLAFVALELGILGVGLAVLIALERRLVPRPWRYGPLLVFGQTALFFYLIHLPVLVALAVPLGMVQNRGIPEAFAAALASLVLTYPLCLWYRGYKAAHPRGWPQYI